MMKKVERFLACSGLILFVLGIPFKIMHWPGAGVLFMLSSCLLPLLILFCLFVDYKGLTGEPLQISDSLREGFCSMFGLDNDQKNTRRYGLNPVTGSEPGEQTDDMVILGIKI